ncbi:class I SAM-dependent methyltransferase [Symbiopectobacterium sp. RP]|uniref:class I SAM-dependent methyltransferase n=1 Tax=Symbiopectobacterium sp. RP TaxID=3248553 RepID=UPI003D29A868
MDKAALQQARHNILAGGVEGPVTVMEANALALPFPDNHFDVVISEAMLTMYADKAKRPLIQEYLRVLKPGGRLLTHDIMLLPQASGDVTAQMRAAINVNIQPL